MGKKFKDRIKWLRFRDVFVASQREIKCFYCGRPLVSDAPDVVKHPTDVIFKRKKLPRRVCATVDHVVPISRGGERWDEANLVIACDRCNNKKAAMTVEEWEAKKAENIKENV